MRNLIKTFLAILLLICVFNMPYGYYQFVRFSAMTGFLYLSYLEYVDNEQMNSAFLLKDKQNRLTPTFLYLFLAVLFQPFIKIALGRLVWNIVVVIVALELVISMLFEKNKKIIKYAYISSLIFYTTKFSSQNI